MPFSISRSLISRSHFGRESMVSLFIEASDPLLFPSQVVYAYNANETTHDDAEIPWYDTLCGSFSLSGFRMTHFGRICTHGLVWTLETLHIAPRGSSQVRASLHALHGESVYII